MIKSTALAPATMVGMAISLFAAAPGDQPPPSAQQPPASSQPQAPKKQQFGSWWEKNAMKLKPLPTRWLFHGEGTLSYMNASGNLSGSTFEASADGEVRKDRFTSHSLAQWNRKNLVYGLNQSSLNSGSVDFAEQTLREQVDFDPTETITFFGVVEGYKNSLMYMDKRLLVYGGMGGRVFRTEKCEIVLNGGVGHASFTFDRAQLSLVNPGMIGVVDTSPSSGGGIGTQSWKWKVSPRFSFSEDASYMKYFDSTLGHRWTINLSGTLPIDKRFSFMVTYRIKEETADIIKALAVLPQDRVVLMGFKVSM